MNLLDRKLQRFYIFFFCVVVLLSYFSLYVPLKGALSEQIYQNFKLVAEAKVATLDQTIRHGLQSAGSISSRTMIRLKIDEYLTGQVSWSDLQNYTESKYLDGLDVVENLQSASRIVDGKVLVQYGEPVDFSTLITEPDFDFSTKNPAQLTVWSPIHSEGTVIGMDILMFDLTPVLEGLNASDIHIAIVTRESILENGVDPDLESGNQLFCEHFGYEPSVVFFSPLNDQFYAHVAIPESALYASVNRIALWSITGFIGGLLLLFAGVLFFVVRMANRQLTQLGESRDQYRLSAHTDPLTGAYTRHYLETWIRTNHRYFSPQHKLALVMLDINGFKEINDDYGHVTGDAVLRDMVRVLQDSIRSDDIVIRYGGDEFIILLKDICEDESEPIMRRVTEILASGTQTTIPFSIAYGIECVPKSSDFEEALKRADAKMYRSKKHSRKTEQSS